jgi:hypothetical protein
MFGRVSALARGFGGCLLAAGLVCPGGVAQAKPLTFELIWNAPQGCPDDAQVLAAIQRLMGTTESQGAPALSVQGDIESRGETLVLKLVWRTASMQAERIMEASSCDELARAAALVVALAADPSSAETSAPEAESPPREPSFGLSPPASTRPTPATQSRPPAAIPNSSLATYPAPGVVGDFSSPPSSSPSSRAPTRPTTRALLALDAGSLPHIAEGAALGAGLGLGLVAFQAELALFVPQQKVVSEGAAELWLSTLSLRPCLSWSLSRLRVSPCAVLELDLLVGQGEGVEDRQAGAAWFPRFGAGAGLGYPLSKQFAWIADAWLLAGPWRPTFVLQDVVPVHEPNLLVGRWTTGLELRL